MAYTVTLTVREMTEVMAAIRGASKTLQGQQDRSCPDCGALFDEARDVLANVETKLIGARRNPPALDMMLGVRDE